MDEDDSPTLAPTKNDESWFMKLDWTDEKKFQSYGLAQNELRAVSEVPESTTGNQSFIKSTVNRKSEVVSPLKHTTVIGKLLDNSKKKIDSEFDHMDIRQHVVA